MKNNTYNAVATEFNERYQITEDEIVSLPGRYNKYITSDTNIVEFIETLMNEFLRRNGFTSFDDMYDYMVRIPKSEAITLGQLVINVGMQRIPDIEWLISIIGRLTLCNINSINVYPIQEFELVDSENADYYADVETAYAVFDGQHTSLLLLCVAIHAFGLSLEEALKLKVPVSVYPAGKKAELRQRFIGANDGTMSKPLDKVDLWMQYVLAVAVDGSTDPWHLRMHSIQQAMAENDIFFTHEKFGNADAPGALTRPGEIFPDSRDLNKWPLAALEPVFKYHKKAIPEQPIAPLEMDNLAHIFRACYQQGITVDESYLDEMISLLQRITGNTWKKGYKGKDSTKHQKVLNAYKSWYKRQHYATRSHYNERCNQTEVGPTWICQALANAGFTKPLPEFKGKFFYEFTAQELV